MKPTCIEKPSARNGLVKIGPTSRSRAGRSRSYRLTPVVSLTTSNARCIVSRTVATCEPRSGTMSVIR